MSYKPGDLIIKPAISQPSNPEHGAAIIFLHGFGDDGLAWASVFSISAWTKK
jgi:predicted esterase